MTINVKPILDAGLAVQSASLLGMNVAASREMMKKSKPKPGKPLKKIVKTGVNNIVGISLIRAQGQLISLI